jgi:dienelactone hydrolase
MKRLTRLSFVIFFATSAAMGFIGAEEKPVCEWLKKPVDDSTFKAYLEFFAYDKALPFETQSLDIEEHEGVRKEHLSFLITPGERMYANLYSAVSPSTEKEPALIYIHGGVGMGKDVPRFDVVARLFARAGWKILFIDMKFFGERRTDFLKTHSEEEKHEKLYNNPPAYLTWVIQTVKDVRRSVDFLIDERNVDLERIGLIGFSRGAVVGTVAAGVEKRLSPIVLLYGGHFDLLEREHKGPACPANYIGRISPRPILMINGIRDADFIKETSVDPMYKLARQPKKIIWVDGGHAAMTDEARSEMLDWLRENSK